MLRPDGIAKVLTSGLPSLPSKAGVQTVTEFKQQHCCKRGLAWFWALPITCLRNRRAVRRWMLGRTFGAWAWCSTKWWRGAPPFRGETPSDCIAEHPDSGASTFIQCVARCSAKLESILQKALRKNTDERYQTSKEMLAELRNLRTKLESESSLSQTKSAGDKVRQTKRPKRTLLVTLVAAVLVAAAVAGFFFFGAQSSSADEKSIAVYRLKSERR